MEMPESVPERMSESSLRLLKARAFDLLSGTAGIGMAILDRELRYQVIDEQLASFNGVSVEQHLGRRVDEVLPKLAPVIMPELQSVLDTGVGLEDLKISGETPSTAGREGHWLASYLPLNDGDETVGILAIARNHTIEYELQQAKEQAATLVRRVLDSLFAFVGMLEPDGTLIDANKVPLEAAGISLDDVLGKKFWDCFWWNYDPAVQQQLKIAVERAAAGEISRYDVPVQMEGGNIMTIDFMIAPLLDEQGNITHLIPSANDITERVQSEELLRASEDRFRTIFDNTADGLLLLNSDGEILISNSRAQRILNQGGESLVGGEIAGLFSDEQQQRFNDMLRMTFSPEQAENQRGEFTIHTDSGTKLFFEVMMTPIFFPEGIRVLATLIDLTTQKTIQNYLHRSLEEKTALLNEVHHRVKNNLQVVSSLLNLQSRTAPPSLRDHFSESQSRIKAMALIHQQLYEQSDFDRIEINSYLHCLIDLFRRSFTSKTRAIRFNLEDAQQKVFISLENALPFGLLVNEIITNSIKHAFHEQQTPTISLSVKQQGSRIQINIADNGIGLPADFCLGQGESLGVQLMPGLADQMRGQLTVSGSEQGAEFVIELLGSNSE